MNLEEAEKIIHEARGQRFLVYPYTGELFRDVRSCKFFELRHTAVPFGRYRVVVAIDPQAREVVGHRVLLPGSDAGPPETDTKVARHPTAHADQATAASFRT